MTTSKEIERALAEGHTNREEVISAAWRHAQTDIPELVWATGMEWETGIPVIKTMVINRLQWAVDRLIDVPKQSMRTEHAFYKVLQGMAACKNTTDHRYVYEDQDETHVIRFDSIEPHGVEIGRNINREVFLHIGCGTGISNALYGRNRVLAEELIEELQFKKNVHHKGDFTNFTPHEITVYYGDKETIKRRIPPSGLVLRVAETSDGTAEIDVRRSYRLAVPMVRKAHGDVYLTDKDGNRSEFDRELFLKGGVMIVSPACLDALASDNAYAPDAGPEAVVRGKVGQVVGVTRLYRREV